MALNVVYEFRTARLNKLPPTAPLSQALTLACQFFKVNNSDFTLMYKDTAVDLSRSMTLSNIPQGATMQLVKASGLPSQKVKVGLKLKDGKLLQDEFSSESRLWDVLVHFETKHPEYNFTNYTGIPEPEKNSAFEMHINLPGYMQPVITFMNRKFSTNDILKQTSLASVGLNSGAGKLALDFQYTPPKLSASEQADIVANFQSRFQNALSQQNDVRERILQQAKSSSASTSTPSPTASSTAAVSSSAALKRAPSSVVPASRETKVWYAPVGRISSSMFEDLPDEFYEINITDAQTYAKGIQAQANVARGKIEEVPPESSKMRSDYVTTRIRFRMPNSFFLEGVFGTGETVADLVAFVKENLTDPSLKFSLSIHPPRKVLTDSPSETLYSLGLLPAAIVNFSSAAIPNKVPDSSEELVSLETLEQDSERQRLLSHAHYLHSSLHTHIRILRVRQETRASAMDEESDKEEEEDGRPASSAHEQEVVSVSPAEPMQS